MGTPSKPLAMELGLVLYERLTAAVQGQPVALTAEECALFSLADPRRVLETMALGDGAEGDWALSVPRYDDFCIDPAMPVVFIGAVHGEGIACWFVWQDNIGREGRCFGITSEDLQ